MYKRRILGWEKHLDFIILDSLCLQLALVICYMVYNGRITLPYFSVPYRVLALLMTLVNVGVIVMLNTMHNIRKRGYYIEFTQIVKQALLVFASVSFILFALQAGSIYSRLTFVCTMLVYIPITYFARIFWKRHLVKTLRKHESKSMLLVCNEANVQTVLNRSTRSESEDIIGLVLLNRDAEGETVCSLPVVANLDNAADYICREWVDEVFIYPDSFPDLSNDLTPSRGADKIINDPFTDFTQESPDSSSSPKTKNPVSPLARLIQQCREMAVPTHIRISLGGIGGKSFVEKVNGFNVITTASNFASPLQLLLKRFMDILGGVVGSLIALLIMLFIGPIIKIKSPGPMLFKQERIGQNGKHFKMYKLRSMYMDADERKKEFASQNRVADGLMFKLDFDPRIIGNEVLPDGSHKTGIGEFIRRTSLDEFPQFFNVLKGDMSLVGTRPPTLDEWEKYQYHHRARLSTKPGITGMWQVSGRSKITDFEEIVRLDTEYINNWSIGLDIRILIKTVQAVLHRDGAM